MQNETDIVM